MTRIFGFLLLCFLIISCDRAESVVGDDSSSYLNVQSLSKDEWSNISRNLKEASTRTNRLMDDGGSDSSNDQYSILLSPMVQNGQEIFIELLPYLLQDAEFQNMSQQEKEAILNFDESQYAELTFVYSQIHSAELGRIDPRIRNCISAAIGVAAIRDLVLNAGALGTVGTTVSAIKLIGRRYLGWVGVAWMVMDFVDCVESF